jgi:hypothetical protein
MTATAPERKGPRTANSIPLRLHLIMPKAGGGGRGGRLGSRGEATQPTVGSALTKKIQGARPGEPVQGGRRDGAPPPPPYLQDQALPSRSRPAAAHPPRGQAPTRV